MQCHECYNHHPTAITFCNCLISEERPSMETMDELIAKLEFENELNRVCNRLSLNMNTTQEDSTGSADSSVEEGAAGEEEEDEVVRLLDMVLDMEQDYELFVY